jgi:hypothetical protein
MRTKSEKIYKGMVFAGCSFTWGQGLYYYSNLPSLRESDPNFYDSELINDSHNSFRQTLYFPRLVANHFNTFEISKIENGGSEQTSFKFLKCVFGMEKPDPCFYLKKHEYDDIEYIILQLSQPQRNSFFYVDHNERDNIFSVNEFSIISEHTHEKFYNYLQNKRKINFESWYKIYMRNWVDLIKNNLQFFESLGIKTLIINWEPSYLEYIQNDDWYNQRIIKFDYKDKIYTDLKSLMEKNNGLTINDDYENFVNPPKDQHPSKKCHKIIADSIIKKIELGDVNYSHKKNENIQYKNHTEIIENIFK